MAINITALISRLDEYILSSGKSQATIAKECGFDPTYISNIKSGKYKPSVEFVNELKRVIGYSEGWVVVETKNLKRIKDICTEAQDYSIAIGICDNAGMGKSAALNDYQYTNKNTFYLECEEYFNDGKCIFLRKLCETLGLDTKGSSEMLIDGIIAKLKSFKKPLLILDEFDKLDEKRMGYFKTLYNKLQDVCGFVVCGVPHLEKKIKRGIDAEKMTYREIFSRLGGRLETLKDTSREDIEMICKANGLTDKEGIKEVLRRFSYRNQLNSENNPEKVKVYDLRDVKREILQQRNTQQLAEKVERNKTVTPA